MKGVAEQLLENSPDIFMRFDREIRCLYVNQAIAQWIDIQPENLLGKTPRELGVDDKICDFCESVIGGIFASGVAAEHEITVPTKHGQRIFNWRGIPEFDVPKQVKSVLSVARDITVHRMTERDLRRMFAEMIDGFALHEIICDQEGAPVDYRFLEVNPAFEQLTGLTAKQVVGKRILDVLPATEPYWIETYGKVALTGEKTHFEHFSKGVGRHFEVKAYCPKPGQFACIFSDITERKLTEAEHSQVLAKDLLRLQRKLGISGMAEQSNQVVYDYMLAGIVELTDSDYGYIYFYDEETELLTLHAWSDQVLPACAVAEPQTQYSLSKTGFWGEVVRQRKSIINNDFSAPHVWKKGYPEGHAPLFRFLSVPIFEGKKIVAVAGVANKVEPYTEQDALSLQEFSQFIWSVIQQRIEHQKVNEERTRFEALGEASFGGVFMHDEGVLLECNQKLSDITGYSYQELVGMSTFGLIATEYHDTVSAHIRCGYDQAYEVVGVRKDGGTYPLAIRGKNIYYQGRDVRVVEFQDLTDFKRMEESYRAFAELSSDYVYKCVRVGTEPYRIQWVNGATGSILGYSSEELLAMACWLSLVHPDDRQAVNDHLLDLRPDDRKTMEFRIVSKEKDVRWVSERSCCIAGALAGELILLGAVTDITERKKAEAKREQDQQIMRERKEFIKSIINSTTEAIFGLDREGRCIFINQTAQQLLGYEAGQLIGQPVYELIAHTTLDRASAEEDENMIQKVIASGHPRHVSDSVFWKNDGGSVNVDYVVRPIVRSGEVYGVVVTFSDVSERKKQMEQRIRSGQLASLGELATGMAHEINNPITGVINCAQLLQNKYAQHDYENKILSMIIKEGNRISNIVKNLLVFAHRNRDTMDLVDIKNVVNEPLLLTEQQLINDGIYYDVDIVDNLPKIYGNCQRLEQVILNLISNSRHALNSKYPEHDPNKILRISAREVAKDDGSKIELIVYDQGCGISKQTIKKVFNTFFTTKPAGVGTGLGLSIIHDIIEEHGATINIESEFGSFTKVIINIPVGKQPVSQ